jgi:hypothetical protein
MRAASGWQADGDALNAECELRNAEWGRKRRKPRAERRKAKVS